MDIETETKQIKDNQVCLIGIGMAGSGKTTFMKQLSNKVLY